MSQAQHHRVATPARCARCDGSPPLPLHLAIIRNDFPMMFPPVATWTRAVGLRGLGDNKEYIKEAVNAVVILYAK